MRWSQLLAAAAVVAAVWVLAPAAAAAQQCVVPDEMATPFEVDVDIEIGEPEIDNSYTKAQLGVSMGHRGTRRQILGTTESGLSMRWFLKLGLVKDRRGYCAWVRSADVKLTYDVLDVNVASEYQPGSCQYNAVLDHEYEHVEAAHSILAPYERAIRAALTTLEVPTSHVPLAADSPEAAREHIEETFRRILLPVRARMSHELARRQAEIDTPENYQRTFRRCRSW